MSQSDNHFRPYVQSEEANPRRWIVEWQAFLKHCAIVFACLGISHAGKCCRSFLACCSWMFMAHVAVRLEAPRKHGNRSGFNLDFARLPSLRCIRWVWHATGGASGRRQHKRLKPGEESKMLRASMKKSTNTRNFHSFWS